MSRNLLVLFSGLVMCTSLAVAQDLRVVDSLQNLLRYQSGGDRFPTLYDLTFEYVDKDNHKALQYITEASKAARLSNDSLWIVKSIRVRAQLFLATSRPKEALSLLETLTGHPALVRFGKEYFEVMNAAAACYLFMSRFDKSLELHFRMHQEAKKRGSADYEAEALSNIGLVYYKLKDYGRARDYMRRGLHTEGALGTARHVGFLNLGLCCAHLGDFDSARMYLKRSAEMCDAIVRNENQKHQRYASGYIYYASGDFVKARGEFLESLRMAQIQEDARIQLDNLYLLAKMSIQVKALDEARKYLSQAEQVIGSYTPFNLEKTKVYEQLSQLYLGMNSFEKAAYYQSRYIRLKDSLYNEKVTATLMRVESQYLESENKAKIAEQAQVIHLNEEIMRRQRQLNFLYATVTLLASVIIVVLFRDYCRKKSLNAFLHKKVHERTRELEISQRELEVKARQQEIMLCRAYAGISAGIATLMGLCLTAREEIDDPVARGYMEKIDGASLKVKEFLESVVGSRQSIETE